MKRSLAVSVVHAASCVLSLAFLGIAGCDNYPGYPHSEQPMHADDNYKAGNGYYGGVTGEDQSHKTPGGPSSTAPLGGEKASSAVGTSPAPGMMQTGTYGNNSAAGSSGGMTPNNGTAPTQDAGSH